MEELDCRLLLMSLVVFVLALVRREGGKPSISTLWFSNALCAVLFGVGHLPAEAQLRPLTPLNIIAIVTPNAMCGLLFGYLFLCLRTGSGNDRSLLADIVLHVIPPIIFPHENVDRSPGSTYGIPSANS